MATTSTTVDLLGGTLGYGADGYYATRIFHVKDIEGNADARLYTALQAPNIPKRNDLHPAGIGLPVDDIRAESVPGSPNQAKITVTYKAPRAGTSDPEPGDTPQLSLSTSLQSIETHFDANGAQLVTKHGDEQIATTMSLNTPVATVHYRRREPLKSLHDPRDYVGMVNNDTEFAGGVGCWLCTGMDRESTDGGITYITSYGFQWKPPYTLKKANGTDPLKAGDYPNGTENIPGWHAYIIEYDSDGNPVKEPVLGEGINIVQMYPAVSFAPLELTYSAEGSGGTRDLPPPKRPW